MGTEEETKIEAKNVQQSIASTSAVPDTEIQVIGPSQDFFQTLNGQVSSLYTSLVD